MSGKRYPAAWRTLVFVGGLSVVAATVAVYPSVRSKTHVLEMQTGPTATPRPGETVLRGPQPGATPGAAQPGRPGLECAAGRNGGATDTGVTANSIKLGSTVVDSGIGASFLRDARYSMIAVKNRVNRAGGICGRKLELVLRDDGWTPDLGSEFIRNLVEQEKVFTLAVVPSSEGLLTVSTAGYLKAKRVPVVGSDGMLIHQYQDPWIWPVAASTISTMHVMVKHAADVFKAKNFAIVYESTYHFGIEGAYAFNQAVKRVTGHDVPGYSNPLTAARCQGRFCGIDAKATSYSGNIETFNNACFTAPKCDYIALLLEPATALKWIKGGAIMPPDGFRMGGVQPLFTRSFAEDCGSRCNGMWLWTGYDPALPGELGRPEMRAFKDAIQATSSSADYQNTFVEGAYIGMELLVEALQRAGPDLTRERLRSILDSMRFDSGLTAPLSWRPGDHFANVRMRAFSIQFRDRFSGWADVGTTLNDPWVGQDIP
jgi:branched-chain amino acid transport system substrate-binding protein